jgi:hypothetical protein
MDKPLKEMGMRQANRTSVFIVLVATILALGGIAIAKGGFYLGKHEGDTLHMAEIVSRMAVGQLPHIDFMSPIGALAFAPIALFKANGIGIGMSVLWSQILVALAFLLPTFWIAISRFPRQLAAPFGFVVLALILALVHGEAESGVSISMHYNRWAWAAAYLAIPAALFVPQYARNSVFDGIIIGLMLSVMAMIKVTYFVAFAPVIVIALLLTGQVRAFGVAILTGLGIVAILTAWLGIGFWWAYVADLQTVAGSENRSAPGLPLNSILSAPAYLGGSIAAIAGVIFLRRAGANIAGLILLLLIPGFIYVTYQNFGNDPQWLLLMAFILLANRPEQGDDRALITGVALMSIAFATPSFLNLAYSPFRHFNANVERFTPLISNTAEMSDIYTLTARAIRVDATVALDAEGQPYAAWQELSDRDAPVSFKGEVFANCSIESGITAFFTEISNDLTEAGYQGAKLFAADLLNSYWLYGEFEPLTGGAPWYYGGLSGFDDAEYLIVPLCPLSAMTRDLILAEITEAGADTSLTEVRRTPIYVLYEKS